MPTARDRPPEEAAEDTSFARGLRLLLTVADRGLVRADELSAALEMPASSVYRYLRTLQEFGFLDRQGGGYQLGPRLLIGTGSNVSSQLLVRVGEPILRTLVDETGETAMILRRIGLSAVCLTEVSTRNPLRVEFEVGGMTPLYAGAMGRVLLAYAPAEILEEVVASGLAPLTPHTPDEKLLRSSLAEIQASGAATSEGEVVSGSVAVAVPIMGQDGIVGSLAVIGPAARCGLAWRTRSRRLAHGAADTITAALVETGWA
jgi:IclR family acetate operon transcriptional repressor